MVILRMAPLPSQWEGRGGVGGGWGEVWGCGGVEWGWGCGAK